jgi:hypothetical protein
METAVLSFAEMISSLTPHALVSTANPLFDYALKRLRRPSDPRSLKRFSRVTLGIATAVVVIFVLCAYVAYRLVGGDDTNPFVGDWGRSLQPFVQFVSIAAALCADLYYVGITSNSINVDKASARWDLLRVTTLPEHSILAAVYAMLQIRGWRVMALERAIAVAFALGNLLFFASYYLEVQASDPIGLLPPFLAVVAAFFIPMWRMQAITALGIAASSRVRQASLAALITAVCIIPLHIPVGLNLLDSLAYVPIFVFLLQFAPALMYAIVFLVSYIALPMFLYWLVKTLSLRYALRAAFRPE